MYRKLLELPRWMNTKCPFSFNTENDFNMTGSVDRENREKSPIKSDEDHSTKLGGSTHYPSTKYENILSHLGINRKTVSLN